MQAGSSVHWVEQSHERDRFLSHLGSRSHFIGSSCAAFWAALHATPEASGTIIIIIIITVRTAFVTLMILPFRFSPLPRGCSLIAAT
jgi:hypothetical protein